MFIEKLKINLFVLFSLAFFVACSGGAKQPLDEENSQYPTAPQKTFLYSANFQASDDTSKDNMPLDSEYDESKEHLRAQNCKLHDPKEQSNLSAILEANHNFLFKPISSTDDYNYAFENILGSTKNLIDGSDCFYPELYLAHANILLRISEIPSSLLNSENRLIKAKLRDQEQNQFAAKDDLNIDLKYSKFAKLNSVIRESQTALNILQDDNESGVPFEHISTTASVDCSQPIDPNVPIKTYLFDTPKDVCKVASSDSYQEAEVFSNYLLSKAHYERAQYRLQGIISAEDLNDIVTVPNDLNFLGDKNYSNGSSTVRDVIEKDLLASIQGARVVYSSELCSPDKLQINLPAHMSTMCGDLKNIFGNDLSVTTKPLEQMSLDNNVTLQIGRLICTADSSYFVSNYEQKFCQNFINKFPNTKNTNLKTNGMKYSDINSWALNLAGVTQHLKNLNKSLTDVISNISQNKDNILKTEEVNAKIAELNAQAISIGGNDGNSGTILIAQDNVKSKQSSIIAQESAVSSAQVAIITLQNQKLNAKNDQINTFRDYLTSLLKKESEELLLNSTSMQDEAASIAAFKKAVADNAANVENMLSKEKDNTLNQWVSQCANSVLIYNNNIKDLKSYNCEINIDPSQFWSSISNENYKDQINSISSIIQNQISNGCQGVAALAGVVRAGQLHLQDDAPTGVDGTQFSNTNFMNYASALASLSSEQQSALNSVAQIEAAQAQFDIFYQLNLSSDKMYPFNNPSISDIKYSCQNLAKNSSELSGLQAQILQNYISSASQKANAITSDRAFQVEKNSLNTNIIDLTEKIHNDAQLLSLSKDVQDQYENELSSPIQISMSDEQFNNEVQKFSDNLSEDSPSIKILNSQLEGAKAEEQRAESLLNGANADLLAAQNNLLSLHENYQQIQNQIVNYTNSKNSFIFSSLVPSKTSYENNLYLLSDVKESAESLLKVLAFRTMSFEEGVLSKSKYTQFLIDLDSTQQQCRYFSSFDDANQCISSLRNILDPNVAKNDYGLYGSDTTKLIMQIYSDDYYVTHNDILDERTPEEVNFNNQFIQKLRNSGLAVLPLNATTLAATLQDLPRTEVLKEYALKRVVGVSVDVFKNQVSTAKDISYSQEDRKIAVLRDGLNNTSEQVDDCSEVAILAQQQALQTKQILIDHKFTNEQFSVQLQNLMSPNIMKNIICQKVNWVENSNSNLNINNIVNINDLNTANTNWITKLKTLKNHNIVVSFEDIDGGWNKIPSLYNPQEDNMSGGNYSNNLRGCIYEAINTQTATNLSSFQCDKDLIHSEMNFENVAGRPLLGSWNFVYGEYGIDAKEYDLMTRNGNYREEQKSKLTGIEITFYLSNN